VKICSDFDRHKRQQENGYRQRVNDITILH
jgi:hypothetical protein